MSNQCQVRHASLACKGWGAPSPDLPSAWHSVWSPWVPTVLLFTTSDGHFTQIYINYFWLFEVGVSLLILQKSLGRACDTSHNSDWQMLFSSIRRADEFSQGWLRQISQLYASSCREIGGQEFTSEKRSSVHGPGRNSDIAGVFESGLAMQTKLADVAPARPAADINAAQKKKGREQRCQPLKLPRKLCCQQKARQTPETGEHARRFLLLGMQSFPRGEWGLAAAHLPPAQLPKCLPRWERLLEMAHAAPSSFLSPVAAVRGRNSM